MEVSGQRHAPTALTLRQSDYTHRKGWARIALSVRIATRYRLDGPAIESRWGQDFPHLSRPALGPTQPPIQWVTGVKRPGRGVDHPHPI